MANRKFKRQDAKSLLTIAKREARSRIRTRNNGHARSRPSANLVTKTMALRMRCNLQHQRQQGEEARKGACLQRRSRRWADENCTQVEISDVRILRGRNDRWNACLPLCIQVCASHSESRYRLVEALRRLRLAPSFCGRGLLILPGANIFHSKKSLRHTLLHLNLESIQKFPNSPLCLRFRAFCMAFAFRAFDFAFLNGKFRSGRSELSISPF